MTMLADMPTRRPIDKTKPISLRIDKELMREVNAYIESRDFPPTLTQVIERALRKLVEDERRSSAPRPERRRG